MFFLITSETQKEYFYFYNKEKTASLWYLKKKWYNFLEQWTQLKGRIKTGQKLIFPNRYSWCDEAEK